MAPNFTRTGDDGTTGTLGDTRLPKHHIRVETLGTLDEASAALGFARASVENPQTSELVLAIQRDLYHIMAEVAATPENAKRFRTIDERRVTWLEEQIQALEKSVQIPGEFIVPGDTAGGAALSLARTIVRRAERRMSELFHQGGIENDTLLSYLNRLSSLCFMLELFEIQQAGKAKPSLAKTGPTE